MARPLHVAPPWCLAAWEGRETHYMAAGAPPPSRPNKRPGAAERMELAGPATLGTAFFADSRHTIFRPSYCW
jgi:hypothetical protein